MEWFECFIQTWAEVVNKNNIEGKWHEADIYPINSFKILDKILKSATQLTITPFSQAEMINPFWEYSHRRFFNQCQHSILSKYSIEEFAIYQRISSKSHIQIYSSIDINNKMISYRKCHSKAWIEEC